MPLIRVFTILIFTISSAFVQAVPFEGTSIVISGPSQIATDVGQRIAEKGGNVIDVAVAVGLTLSVTSPYYAALGGGGFALLKMAKKVEVLDFREIAPRKTSPKFYLDKAKDASRNGGTAVGVPGFPAGLWEMHKKYGKLKWSQLFEEPLQLAQEGFRVSGEWSRNTERALERFNGSGKKHFSKAGGKRIYRPGERLKQPALARALKIFRKQNVKGFYQGQVAQDIAYSVQKAGGVIDLKDLQNYKVRWLEPLTTEFRGHKIHLMPPPSSGGVVIKAGLKLIERVDLPEEKTFSVSEFHHMGEVLSRAFRGRALLGDPDFHKNPLDHLLGEKYLKRMAHSIKSSKTAKLDPLTEEEVNESKETTHYSIIDKNGNAIALTVTLNGNYGSAVVSERFGIALNNEMDDFTTRPGEPNMFGLIQGKGNQVEPGKRPLSSMSPTLVEKDNKIVMALGAPGGPRIISGVLQVLYRSLVSGMDMDQAIQAPRVHHQFLPHKLYIDKGRFTPETIKALKKRGHEINESWIAKVYGVRLREDGRLEAAYDSRGEGGASGF